LTRPRARVAIFWISLVGLYVELLLIRWIGTEIRIFAYLQNTVLVVCFLGLGVGLFTSRRPIPVHRGLFSLVILAAGLAIPQTREILSHTSSLLSVLADLNIWEMGGKSGTGVAVVALAIGLTLTFLIMILVVEPFIPIGRLLGRLLDSDPRPIVAYSVNVIGSLAGIWLFVGLSRLSQPPTTWFVLLVVLVAPLLLFAKTLDRLSLALLICLPPLVFLAQRTGAVIETVWSPYQKLELVRVPQRANSLVPTARYQVFVNNSGYQLILDLSSSGAGARTAEPVPGITLSTYDVPALLHPDPDRVLVVGAGTGNDVAGLIRNGARHVTAVDIDPVILDFGREYHPERPYQSERVEIVNTDARSFFARSENRYDVIAFGFLDSHASTSLTNAGLDHYVYTQESLTHVRELLNDGGIVTVTFFPLRPFIVDRIAVELRDVFGEEPLAYNFPFDAHGSQGVLFVAGDLETARSRIATVPELGRLNALAEAEPVQLPYTTVPATDDWPYLYLDSARIPLLFVLLAGLLALVVVYAGRTFDLPATMNPRRWDRGSWHFFFLGAAFLLLEVQNISKASVVLGNTWLVNAVIITGVLVMVLIANAVVIRRPEIRLRPVYVVLLVTVVALYLVDLARFAFLPFAWKAIIVGALTTLPMLFSGVAFARAFATSHRKDYALGANLLGALVGAVLQSLSFLLGIKALLLVVGIFYLAAALTRPGRFPTHPVLHALNSGRSAASGDRFA
jgi:SAM-dependent methyltransferase